MVSHYHLPLGRRLRLLWMSARAMMLPRSIEEPAIYRDCHFGGIFVIGDVFVDEQSRLAIC